MYDLILKIGRPAAKIENYNQMNIHHFVNWEFDYVHKQNALYFQLKRISLDAPDGNLLGVHVQSSYINFPSSEEDTFFFRNKESFLESILALLKQTLIDYVYMFYENPIMGEYTDTSITVPSLKLDLDLDLFKVIFKSERFWVQFKMNIDYTIHSPINMVYGYNSSDTRFREYFNISDENRFNVCP